MKWEIPECRLVFSPQLSKKKKKTLVQLPSPLNLHSPSFNEAEERFKIKSERYYATSWINEAILAPMIIRSFLQEDRFLFFSSPFFRRTSGRYESVTIRDCYATWIRTWSGFWVGSLLIESNSGVCLFVLRLINSRHRAQFRYLLGSKWKYKVRFSRVSRGIQRRRHYAVICAERHASGHREIPAYRVVICINSFNLEY